MDGLIQYGGHSESDVIENKVLITYEGKNQYGHHVWEWECRNCSTRGGPSTIAHLKRSKNCLKCSNGKNAGRWTGHEDISGIYLSSLKHNASKRGYAYTVTPEYLWQVWLDQGGRCVYSGRQLAHGEDASLDRIDNDYGYIPANVQWIHRDVNRMKTDFTEERFLKICKEIADFSAGRI